MTDRSGMIRVDQAGEYGATRIYAGQLAVMGDRAPHSAEVRGMAEQEAAHLARFDALIARRGTRPTALQPVWSVAGYALGAATALIGSEAAMACTAAVEEEIDKHYSDQLDTLEKAGDDPELTAMVAEFREDERAHHAAAIAAVQAIAASGPISAVAAPRAYPAADQTGCNAVGRVPRRATRASKLAR